MSQCCSRDQRARLEFEDVWST